MQRKFTIFAICGEIMPCFFLFSLIFTDFAPTQEVGMIYFCLPFTERRTHIIYSRSFFLIPHPVFSA